MHAMLALGALAGRVREFVAAEAADGRLDPEFGSLLERAILFGRMPWADLPGMLGAIDRQARRLVRPLVDRRLLTGAKDAPLAIAFPRDETERLFPSLWGPPDVDLTPLPEVERALRVP